MRTLLGLMFALALALALANPCVAVPAAGDGPTVIVVVGAPGEAEFGTNFVQQAALWEKTCASAGLRQTTVGLAAESEKTDHDRLRELLAEEPKDSPGELWVVLAGHGTFDGKEARFNLRGPDLTAAELAEWLKPFGRPLAVMNTASASAPFLNALSGTNRVVITATRSGAEQNFARFGFEFAGAISDPVADLDQDGQTSVLEAFLSASQRVAEFYKTSGRLATEHALLDDNGDGLGTPADWFRGVRATKRAKDGAAPDGLRAQQFVLVRSPAEQALPPAVRARRDGLERTVAELRERKAKLPEAEYYAQLEALLLELARLYEPAAAR